MKDEDREYYKKEFNEKRLSIIIATSVFGEGVDIPSIDVLVNGRFQKSEVQTVQGIGRALRTTDGKNIFNADYKGKLSCEVYDFFITGNKHLATHSEERKKVYSKETKFNIKIIEPSELMF
jgi:superfamily II DNA or RNA helicase